MSFHEALMVLLENGEPVTIAVLLPMWYHIKHRLDHLHDHHDQLREQVLEMKENQ